MLLSFDEISDNSRIWIYQSNKKVDPETQKQLIIDCQAFLKQWTAHGSELKAAVEFKHNYFLIIALDESHASASGCSIDSSVHFINQLEQKYKLNFFDRSQIALKLDSEVSLFTIKEIKEKFSEGIIHANDLTFNNLIKTKNDLQEKWIIPLNKSWLKRYLSQNKNVPA